MTSRAPSPYDPRNYRPPTPQEIKTARRRANHSQPEAAGTVGMSVGGWRKYELEGDHGNPMPYSVWALYCILALKMAPERFNRGLPGGGHGKPHIGYEAAGRPTRTV